MCSRDEALDILDGAFKRCSEVIPISDAYLYGSYARGDYGSESDVDIMLLSPLSQDQIWPIRRRVSGIANDLSTEHDVTVSVCVRSLEQFVPQRLPYYENIKREGIRYYSGMRG